jgi:hypothetical protein
LDPCYAYLNAVLDDNPSVTALALDNVKPHAGSTAVSLYEVATGPVPAGQRDIQQRAVVTAMPAGSVPSLNTGYDGSGALVIQFFA